MTKSSRRFWATLCVVGALFAVLFLRWRDRAHDLRAASPTPRMGAPVAITAVRARQGDIGVYVSAIGTVTPLHTATITSQVSGMLTAVHYRESQMVRKGDALVEIDSRPYQAQLDQAQGTLDRDRHILEQSRMDLQRYREAWARDAIAKQTLDDQEKTVLQNEASVKTDQGTVDFNKVQLAWCRIAAPFDGLVGLRLVDPGNVVQANSPTPLVILTQIQPITVVFTIAEDYVGQVQSEMRQGRRLTVELSDRAQQTLIGSGALLAIDNQIDTTTGTVRLRAQFDNSKGELFPNQFVNARLLVRTVRDAVLVPTSAIQHNGRDAFVYVIVDDVAHTRTVKPGVDDSGTTAVEGVAAGEVLANSSFERLQDKTPVRVAAGASP